MTEPTLPSTTESTAVAGRLDQPVRPLVERLRRYGQQLAIFNEAADVLERLIEDRARFPDRPDDIGAMIGAHFNNLRAIANTNEEAWRRTQLRSDVEVARLRAALAQIVSDCTARKAVMIARKALEA